MCSAHANTRRWIARPINNWAELWLVNKIFATARVQIQALEKVFTLLDVGSFSKIHRIEGKSLPHSIAVFSMLPNPSKCLFTAKLKTIMYDTNSKIP
jgi:hypothetical protein